MSLMTTYQCLHVRYDTELGTPGTIRWRKWKLRKRLVERVRDRAVVEMTEYGAIVYPIDADDDGILAEIAESMLAFRYDVIAHGAVRLERGMIA